MSNLKASQFTTTRRDIPSARNPGISKASVLQPKDRPSGVCRTAADAATPGEDEREDEDKKAADSSR